MTGISVTISADSDARSKLQKMIARIDDKTDFFVSASGRMLEQTRDRFNEQRGPDGTAWTPLAPLTVALRGGRATPILQDTGSFREEIHAEPEIGRAVVSTAAPQAAVLQYGATITPKAGPYLIFGPKGGKVFAKSVTIPARPYFGFSDENIEALIGVAESSFFDLD